MELLEQEGAAAARARRQAPRAGAEHPLPRHRQCITPRRVAELFREAVRRNAVPQSRSHTTTRVATRPPPRTMWSSRARWWRRARCWRSRCWITWSSAAATGFRFRDRGHGLRGAARRATERHRERVLRSTPRRAGVRGRMLHWLDLAIIAIVGWLTWRAFTVGLIREVVTLAAVLAGVLLAGRFYGELAADIEFLIDDSADTRAGVVHRDLRGGRGARADRRAAAAPHRLAAAARPLRPPRRRRLRLREGGGGGGGAADRGHRLPRGDPADRGRRGVRAGTVLPRRQYLSWSDCFPPTSPTRCTRPPTPTRTRWVGCCPQPPDLTLRMRRRWPRAIR